MNTSGQVRLSVCIAMFNGAKFLVSQLDSIIAQIGPNDEVIICDDKSNDCSVKIVSKYSDSRIKLYINQETLGHVKNFELAISLARGQYILLSDQDDVWVDGRVSLYLEKLQSAKLPMLVVGDFIEINERNVYIESNSKKLKPLKPQCCSFFSIIKILAGKSKYYGCCFGFNREIVKHIIPFPPSIEAHDMWISIIASIVGSIVIIDQVTLLRRLHGNNLTPKRRRGLKKIIFSRSRYIYELGCFLLLGYMLSLFKMLRRKTLQQKY